MGTSRQDRGVGRFTLPPCTTKRRTTTNLKTKTTRTDRKLNEGIKEETFIQTGRRGGDGQPGREDSLSKVVAGGQGGPTFVCG